MAAGRVPEAAFFTRTYMPSRITEVQGYRTVTTEVCLPTEAEIWMRTTALSSVHHVASPFVDHKSGTYEVSYV